MLAWSASLGLPANYLSVDRGPELLVLALAGVVIAIVGALLPAARGARIRTASAPAPSSAGTRPGRPDPGQTGRARVPKLVPHQAGFALLAFG